MPKRGYDQSHGDDGGVLQPDEGGEAALPAAAGPPSPNIAELRELNREVHEDARLPGAYALDQPAPLLGCLEKVHAVDTTSPEGVVKAAALLAHGIAQAQSFRDGNRRTAFIATQVFLERHDLSFVSRGDDDMLTRYLNQVVERQNAIGGKLPPGPDKFEELFLRRLENRTPPGAGGDASANS